MIFFCKDSYVLYRCIACFLLTCGITVCKYFVDPFFDGLLLNFQVHIFSDAVFEEGVRGAELPARASTSTNCLSPIFPQPIPNRSPQPYERNSGAAMDAFHGPGMPIRMHLSTKDPQICSILMEICCNFVATSKMTA